ncbi:hypothetical protein HMPREF0658_2316, partial [Hoylesella marshii DSM 16973 = JCM 13450]
HGAVGRCCRRTAQGTFGHRCGLSPSREVRQRVGHGLGHQRLRCPGQVPQQAHTGISRRRCRRKSRQTATRSQVTTVRSRTMVAVKIRGMAAVPVLFPPTLFRWCRKSEAASL